MLAASNVRQFTSDRTDVERPGVRAVTAHLLRGVRRCSQSSLMRAKVPRSFRYLPLHP